VPQYFYLHQGNKMRAQTEDCAGFMVYGGTAGIDYRYANGVLTVISDTPLTISGRSAKDIIVVNSSTGADITLAGVEIEERAAFRCAFEIASGSVNITLVGENKLKSGSNRAGMQKDTDDSLTINGSGSLNAAGGFLGAGIGGGWNSPGSNIIIDGGTVTAIGGADGAGIGGGSSGSGSKITVNGGNVTAVGGHNGAGIGGGWNSAGSSITISGGNVTASGTDGGAGIGGGWTGSGSNITINGGNVNARGGDDASGIGGGYGGIGSKIKIAPVSGSITVTECDDESDTLFTHTVVSPDVRSYPGSTKACIKTGLVLSGVITGGLFLSAGS
jgi:hypothetical protein